MSQPASTLARYVGRRATYPVGALRFAVTIRDARTRYGEVDVLIEPEAGSGQRWVASTSIRLAEE